MADYIDRDELLENIQRKVSTYDIVTHPIAYIVLGKVYDAIDDIDIVEVVRCKDCDNMYFHTQGNGSIGMRCCFHEIKVEENHFCSYGERKDNENL